MKLGLWIDHEGALCLVTGTADVCDEYVVVALDENGAQGVFPAATFLARWTWFADAKMQRPDLRAMYYEVLSERTQG